MPYEPFDRVAHRADRPADHAPRARRGIDRRAVPAGRRRRRDRASSGTPGTLGIRSFDVAPLYGYGAAERRMGAGLAGRPRDEFVLSTKVGRLVVPTAAPDRRRGPRPPGARRPRRRVLHGHRGPPRSCSTTARTASGARSRRASSGSGSTGSTSPTSTTPTTTGRRRSTARTRRSHRLREAGRGPRDRRRDEPVADAGPVRPRGRHRRDPARRPLHAARPGGARRAAAGVRRAGRRGASSAA